MGKVKIYLSYILYIQLEPEKFKIKVDRHSTPASDGICCPAEEVCIHSFKWKSDEATEK